METKKQRILKILKRIGIGLSLGFNVLFLIALIIGSGASKKQVNNSSAINESNYINEVVRLKPHPRYASYNDESYTITLSVNELNNYNFVNFGLAILNDDDIYVDSIEFSYNEVQSSLFGEKTDAKIYIDYNSTTIDYYFSGYFAIGGVRDVFEYDLVIQPGATYYSILKGAIEADITANESNINDGIFETLTASVTAFVGSLGNGIVAMTSVFYDSANSQLTTIGLLSVIVVAVSLSYFLFRLIIGLIRMRG